MRIFNTIRFQALTTSKILRYLAYAIGEIVLIVAGVLIAVRLNIQNEQRKSHERQLDYLRLIKGEMIENIHHLDQEIEKAGKMAIHTKMVLDLFDKKKGFVSDDSLMVILRRAFSSELKLKYNNGVLSEIKSAGGLREIENDSISLLLAGWNSKIEEVRLQEKDVYDYREILSMLWLEKGNAFQMYPSNTSFEGIGSNWDLMSDQKYTNGVLAFYITTNVSIRFVYNPLKEDTEELIRIIDQEVKRKSSD